jgi:hypothetical protein
MNKKILSKNLNKEKKEYSNTSSTQDHVVQKGKGLLSFLFGSDASNYATKLILDAFEMNAPVISLFVTKHAFSNEVKLDFGKGDNDGRNILHWLVIYSAKIPMAKTLLFDALNLSGISKYLNKQDNAGNTIAHTAMYVAEINNVDMNDVLNMLIQKGVDLKIKNKDGIHVILDEVNESEKVPEVNYNVVNQIFLKKPQKDEAKELSDTEAAQIAEKIAKYFKVPRTDQNDSETINFNRETVKESTKKESSSSTEILAKDVSDILEAKTKEENKPINFGGKLENSENSFEIINDLVEKFNKRASLNKITKTFQKKNEKQIGKGMEVIGKRRAITYSEQNSESLSQNDFPIYKNFTKKTNNDNTSSMSTVSLSTSYNILHRKKGGASEKEEKVYDSDSESTTSSSTSTDTSTDTSSESSESNGVTISSSGGELESEEISESEGLDILARFTPESTKRHDEAIKRIKDLLKVDDLLAKVYKSMLYNKIKNEKKELNNEELSKELEKQASDEKLLKAFVKALDQKEVDNLKKIIKEKTENKEKEPKKDEKKSKKEVKEEKKISRFLRDLEEEMDTDSNPYTSN